MFNQKLKELRKQKRISQEAFATEIGVSQSTVGNWESGSREPNLQTIQKIADYFDVTIDHLLGRIDASIHKENTNPITGKEMSRTEKYELKASLEKANALFFDDEISEEDKEDFLRDITELFWEAKKRNRRK